MATPAMSRCRSCKAEIVWAHTIGGGTMPLDRAPVVAADADVYVVASYFDFVVKTMTTIEKQGAIAGTFVGTFYRNHFVTCPHADQHRRRR